MSCEFLFKTTILLLISIIYSRAQNATNDKNLFHRTTTGVVFSPFAKQAENGTFPSWHSYTLDEIKTMYQVISDRFQITATYGVGSNNEMYEPNMTYHRAAKIVLSAEAASLVNLEYNKLATSILIGVWRSAIPQQMNTEIELAFESAQIANRNFPGTATGIIFTSNDIETDPVRASVTLNQISDYKIRAHKEGLLVGTRQYCEILTNNNREKNSEQVAEIFRSIIAQSDFIICHINAGRQNLTEGVDAVFAHTKAEILTYRDEMKKINPSIEILLESGWPSKDTFSGANAKNLVKYWKLVDQWAHQVNIKALMFEALDSPWKQWTLRAAHFGWWKLQRNEDAADKKGYVEILNDIQLEDAPSADLGENNNNCNCVCSGSI